MSIPASVPFTSVFDALFYDDDVTSGGPTDEGTLAIIKKSRINSVRAATEIFSRLLNADIRSATNRAAVQAMFDGAPPYSEAVLRNQGQAYLSNFSTGVAGQAKDSAMSAYVDMLFSVETLMRIRTNWGGQDEREDWEGIISEEWTRMIREWDMFKFNFLNLANFFVQHGVGIAFYPNDNDWRFRTSGLGDFYLPRMSIVEENQLEVACCTRDYLPHELNELITGEFVDPSWNAKMVEQAINDALLNRSYSAMGPTTINLQPELIQAELKNNDLALSYATNTYIRTVHFWVKETDGTVTHLISLRSGTNTDFLYKKIKKFKDMRSAFTFFTWAIGDNGYIHSVRGMGWKIFNKVQAIDRTTNRANDAAMMASSIMLKPGSENDMQQAAITQIGTATFIDPSMEVVEYQMPNVGEAVLPILQEMKSLMQNDIGQYANPITQGDPSEGTKFAWKAKIADSSKISSVGQLLFYDPLEKLFRNCLIKQMREGYRSDEPGGQEVWEWLRRCVKRGVPIEALRHIDPQRSTVVRAMGAGSESMRVMMYDEMSEMAQNLDPVGRYNFMRDWWAMRLGYDMVDRYMPKQSERRDSSEVKTAMLENNQFKAGDQVDVLPGEYHAVHLPIHIQQLDQLAEALDLDKTQLSNLFPIFMATLNHAIAHAQYLDQDPFHQKEAAQVRKKLQNFNEQAHNGAEELMSEQQKQQASEAESGIGPDGKPSQQFDPEVLKKIQQNQMELQQEEERHQQRLRQNAETQKQKIAFADQTNANKVLTSA